ncbi:MAG: hypothetical protein USCAAHI_00111 [Beijerinckiaceae bacterium]|nr:MAG: hypothetical protein USCAAHI_00111 [Beijerinckiaceae bacterium]
MVVLFFAGQPVAKVAIIGGVLLLFNRRLKVTRSTARSIGRSLSCSLGR